MGKERPYADGGGLCSPGRWAKEARRLPSGDMDSVPSAMTGPYLAALEELRMGK